MKTYAFLNIKGGVGKTTSATTIAHIIASEYNKKVLLIDLDPQGNSSSLFSKKEIDYSEVLYNVLKDGDLSLLKEYQNTVGDILIDPNMDINQVIYKTDYDNLYLIPSFIDLSEVENKLKADVVSPQQFRIKHHLDKIKDQFDYCIIDCSPAVNLVNINGLVCSDYVFAPLNCDMWGFAGYCIAQSLVRAVKDYNLQLNDIHCFLTQWDSRTSISHQVKNIMQLALNENFIDIQIRKSVRAEEIGYAHKTLTDYAGNTKIADDYRKLTKYMIKNY